MNLKNFFDSLSILILVICNFIIIIFVVELFKFLYIKCILIFVITMNVFPMFVYFNNFRTEENTPFYLFVEVYIFWMIKWFSFSLSQILLRLPKSKWNVKTTIITFSIKFTKVHFQSITCIYNKTQKTLYLKFIYLLWKF